MKKKLILLFTLLLTACLMTGCMTSDTNVRIGFNDRVTVEITAMFDKAAAQKNMQGDADFTQSLEKAIKSYAELNASKPDDNEDLLIEKVEEGNMVGIHMKLEYKDWDQFTNSYYFNNIVSSVAPVSGIHLEEGQGLTYTRELGAFGNIYNISGYFTTEDLIAVNGIYDAGDSKDAKLTYKITAPIFTAKSNSLNQSPFRTTHIWEMGDGGSTDIHFTAFIPNPAVLVESILILILIIVAGILAFKLTGKKKKEDGKDEEKPEEDAEEIDVDAENFFEDTKDDEESQE